MQDIRLINAGVYWTLYREWAFYFSLILIIYSALENQLTAFGNNRNIYCHLSD